MILAVVLIILQLGDWWTSRIALNRGIGTEANPVAAFFMRFVGVDGYFAIKTVAVASLVWLIPSPVLLGALVALYAWIVWNNWKVIR